MCAVSFWGLQPLCRRLPLYLQFHDANVPGSHTTVSHDETTSDGPLHTVTLFLLIVLINGIDIKGNAQESIGKCYSYLSHNAREISTLAVENEKMYEHTKESFEKLMKELQEIRKKCHSNNMESCIEVHGDVTTDVLQGDSICRIKTKPTIGRPKRKLKSALKKKNSKPRSKTTHAKKHANGLQKKRL